MMRGRFLMVIAATACGLSAVAQADPKMHERGRYLVEIAGCTDCHTAGYFAGKPDLSRYLAGSDVGFQVPGVGTVIGRNLTPDKETGLGKWSIEQIITAFTAGVRPDGRVLSPVMPWAHYANLAPGDARAIAAFLKTLPAVRNPIPGPFAANERPTTFTWKITPPENPALRSATPSQHR
jgi:mono/diheme cytochrome c family protein